MPENKSIAVIHLVWMPLGIDQFNSFISSYLKYPPGTEHDLVIVFNGVNDPSDTDSYLDILKEFKINHSFFVLPKGQDLDAYFFAAKQVNHELVLFFNSYTQILADDWLRKYADTFHDETTGLVSATGSWESYLTATLKRNRWSYQRNRSLSENLKKYKLLLKASIYWRFLFKPFPNPHARTNGFMIRRRIFLSTRIKKLRKRLQAYEFENGRNSLTRQIQKMGLKVYVVDKWGKVFSPGDWNKARVFWQSQQENLLISDNQTRIYENATEDTKRLMRISAWGNEKV